jgi:hypothetical protein
MDDLITVNIQELIKETKRSRNTTNLIKWLRTDGVVTSELAMFIADILSGEVKANPKKPKFCDIVTPVSMDIVRRSYKFQRANLENISNQTKSRQKVENWEDVCVELKAAGYDGQLDTKGEISKAARHIVAKHFRLTLSQYEEITTNRKRDKTRKK